MSTQTGPSLFDYQATAGRSRRTDPATSRSAARSINLKERKREVLAAMRRLEAPSTARQIQQDMHRHDVSRERGAVASRLSQLEHDGMVRKVGVCQIPTEQGGTGRAECTWALTDAGKAALS